MLAGGGNSFLFDGQSFRQEAGMLEQRSYPEALLIQNTNTAYDGSILVAGGVTPNTGSSNGTTVEINNPQANSWQSAGALTTARSQGTMTLVGPVQTKITPVFSGLTASTSISAGTASILLGGHFTQSAVIPTGSVNIMVANQSVSAPIGSDGSFSQQLNTSGIAARATPYPITYSYAGDANFGSATDASTTLTVTPAGLITPKAVLTVSPTTANAGEPITFTTTVSSPNGPVPTGSITISDSTNGDNRYGNAGLTNGVGTVQNSQIPPGVYTVVATYGGDGGKNYNGAQSNTVTFTINAAN
jgi:hypothetical protein